MSKQAFAEQMRLMTDQTLVGSIVRHSPEAIVVADESGRIQLFNPAAERIFGWQADEVMGRNVRMLMPEPWRSEHDEYLRRYLETGEPHVLCKPGRELEAVRKNGEIFPIELMVAEMEMSGQRRFLGFIRDISVRKQQEAELQRQATHDAVTGLPNLAQMVEALRKSIMEHQRLFLFCISIERFQTMNEVLGHAAGDRILWNVGRRLSQTFEEGEKYSLAHIGGSAFALLIAEPEGHPLNTANAIQDSLKEPLHVHTFRVDVDISIGVVCYPDHGRDADDLLRRARIAMLAARNSQTNFAIFDDEMESDQRQQLELAGELRQAIAEEQLELHYQPKLDIEAQRIAGVEALVRWHHPERGMIRPDLFIPMAEETDIIHAFTAWLLRAAARQAGAWQEMGLDWSVAVNLAPRNLLDADLPQNVAEAIRVSGIHPSRLVAEITERGFIADPDSALDTLHSLHAQGVPISIDDFGTGYSSLAYLKDMPLSELKVDRTFVQAMNTDAGALTIVQTVIQMAHYLGFEVTAEGVETNNEFERLRFLGCDKAQGYLIARPMPADELMIWARQSEWFPD